MSYKALVVDNNPVLLKAISAILAQEGCEVETAETGLQALELLESFQPDIVFTDLIMPLVSGEQLCRIIRSNANFDHVYLVIISGIVLEDIERIRKEINCDLCIAKGNLAEIRRYLKLALEKFIEKRKTTSDSQRTTNAHIPVGLKPSQVARELLLEKRHATAILENLREGIFELNNEGRIVSVNTAGREMIGRPEEEIVGHFLLDSLDWDNHRQDVRAWLERGLANSSEERFEIFEDAPLFLNDKVLTGILVPVSEQKKDLASVFLPKSHGSIVLSNTVANSMMPFDLLRKWMR